MMYLIYNSNGSVKYENLVDFIVQGSNDVNKILISIDEYEPTAFSLSGHFVLPDGTVTDISSDTTDSVEIDGTTYYGVVLSLTSEVTALDGLVRVNIVAKENDTDKVLVTMQTFLTVNSGISGSEIAIISQAEYNNLLSQIQRNVSNHETILTFVYPNTLPSADNYENGQIAYFVAPGNNKGYLYQKISGSWVQVFSFQNYYTKDEVYAKSETYNKTEIDSALSGKLDKLTTSGTYVYGHNGSTQNEYSVSLSPSANSIPVRGENGRLYVAETPTFTAEAASKYYVDSQVATKSTVSGLEANGKWYSLTIDGVTHLIGGGGSSYTAGNGINISGGNEISVDTTVVATQSDLQDVREVAEGKCKTLVLYYTQLGPTNDSNARNYKKADGTAFTNLADFNSYVSGLTLGNSEFNSQDGYIGLDSKYLIVLPDQVVYTMTDLYNLFKVGDIVLVGETEVPDRWVSYITDNHISLYKLETTKVDLTSYYTKTETNGLLANEFSAESTYSVGDYVIYNGTLYRCVSDISTAGAWNSSYWTSVKVANDFASKNANNTFAGTNTFNELLQTRNVSDYQWKFGSTSFNFTLERYNGATLTNRYQFSNSSFYPQYSADLGLSSNKWTNLYLSGVLNPNANGYGLTLPDTTSFTANKEIATTDSFNLKTVNYDNYRALTTEQRQAFLDVGVQIIGTINVNVGGGDVINPYLFPRRNFGTYSQGIFIAGSSNQAPTVGTYEQLHSGTTLTIKVLFRGNDEKLIIQKLSSLNGKSFPDYPSSPTSDRSLTYQTDNTLAYIHKTSLYTHTITLTGASEFGQIIFISNNPTPITANSLHLVPSAISPHWAGPTNYYVVLAITTTSITVLDSTGSPHTITFTDVDTDTVTDF